MVEFGLKLEDNKVSEWSEHYIHYEKLKKILKQCKSARQKLANLEAKKPDEAALVKEAFDAGDPTPDASTDNLSLASKDTISDKDDNGLMTMSEASELTSLFQPKDSTTGDYGSKRSSPSLRSETDYTNAQAKSSNAIHRAFSGVSDYFYKSYGKQLRQALKEAKSHSLEFESVFKEEIVRVNAFYFEEVKELEVRLLLLKESVAQSRGSQLKPVSDSEETSLVASRKSTALNMLSLNHQSVGSVAEAIRNRLKIGEKSNQRSDDPTKSVRFVSLSGNHDGDEDDNETTKASKDQAEDARKTREAQSIKRALVDQYRTATLLHNFSIMNYTGFVKIVKKHDKTVPDDRGKYKTAVKPENICNQGKDVEELIERLEILFANWFCGRDRNEARAQMLPKRGDGLQMDWSQLRLGFRMGMCSILGLWVCWDCIWGLVQEGKSTIGGRTAFPVFRGCFGLLLLEWFWGCSIWVWTRYRVNYIYIMDLDPNIVRSPLLIFNDAVDDTLFYLITMLLYYKAGVHDIPGAFPAGVFPACTVIYALYRLIFPLRLRIPLWQAVYDVVTTPMTSPAFFHSYVGDIFTSMVKVFQDLAWTICFMLSGDFLLSEDAKESASHEWSHTTWYSKVLIPLLTLAPLWFRFNQCLRRYMDTGKRMPHIANAFKYALSQTVTLFGAFHPLSLSNKGESTLFQLFWTFAFVSSSLYSFFWDVFMDWGLGLHKHGLLGPRLMYPQKSFYYGIICVDFVLRFAWVLTLVPPESGAAFALPAYLSAVSMMLELFRRTVWGFLRLENEHRSNTAGYRRVDFIPLHFSTGHLHEYRKGKEHSGRSVLIEVAFVTLLVVGAAVISVIAAQHASENAGHEL